jgi:hypothetical protein
VSKVPGFIRTVCIRRLARLTADAFGVPAPGVRGPALAALDTYARFTTAEAERALWSGPGAAAVQARLFSNARQLGRRLRAGLLIGSPERAAAVLRTLYLVIGVEFTSAHGEFRVTRCFFASRYSPLVCGFISSLDAGLFSGLSGGGVLEFRQRISEGAAFCKGVLN